ncbi:PREDICTED: uncharacterized protein LOC109165530 [Ipomoea nil]|uniref:uncharacterized protein LOC109165530 n=1 Tax=Ipomoea nil TaxID=35883 RepID=UPI000900B6EA|nr:PREDICTED: uncharacterized protein LOC109165530 [Ipomoea nil]
MEKLVAMLGDDEPLIGLKDVSGKTPLHVAASQGNVEVADILVRRNSNLLYLHNNHGLFPIHYAARNRRKSKDAFLYFFSLTKADENGHPNPYAGSTGAAILANLIELKFYDVGLMLVKMYPDLGRHKILNWEITALGAILRYDCPIINTRTLSHCQSFIYYCVSKRYVVCMLKSVVVNKMVMHQEALKLLKCLCDQLKTLDETQVCSLALDAIFLATSLDIGDVVLNIVEAYPRMAYLVNQRGENILMAAVRNRSENVFNLVCGTTTLMDILVECNIANNQNSILHLAGKLAPPHKLNLVSGAALQMQRELQWFEEVQKIAPPYFSSLRNKDEKSPKMVFTDEHKDLKKEGEKWMKETATACSIVAALIVTVAFAAAITVPRLNNGGGFNATIVTVNNDASSNGTIIDSIDEGLPIFSRKNAFRSFYIFNSLSLFMAVPSLLLFLSIQISRYAEEDFLHSLPWKLIVGINTLLSSVMYMMGSFITTVNLVFGNTVLSVRVALRVCAGVTLVALIILQFRLFLAFLWSTYGQTILKKLKDGRTADNLF